MKGESEGDVREIVSRTGVEEVVRLSIRVTPSIDSSTPVISSSEFRIMRLEECEMDSISTLRPCEIGW